MAITFVEETKRQRNLIIIFILLVLVTLSILWLGYFRKTNIPAEVILKQTKKIEIDLNFLENPLLEELTPIEKISPIEQGIEVGRKNPFEPY